MRSFIKSHRRFDSSTSDLQNLSLEPPQPQSGRITPASSPKLTSEIQFTPPSANHASNSLNSPKKLFSPIKNLFTNSGVRKNGKSISHSNDVYANGIGKVSDISDRNTMNSRRHYESNNFVPRTSGLSNDIPSALLNNTGQENIGVLQEAAPIFSSSDRPQNTSPESSDRTEDSSCSNKLSDTSSSRRRQVSFTRCVHTVPEAHLVLDDDSESSDDWNDSDTSSQFSFIKDRKGGRNTSVKYYKTSSSKDQAVNTFDEKDLNYELDEFSDYDYENNGIGDDELLGERDYDIEEEDFYNRAFGLDGVNDDDGNTNAIESVDSTERMTHSIISNTGDEDLQWRANSSTANLFYSAYHKSIEKSSSEDIENFVKEGNGGETQIRDDECKQYEKVNNEEDNKSTHSFVVQQPLAYSTDIPIAKEEQYQSPVMEESDSLDLFDINSPMINGVTIGQDIRHRYNSRASRQDGVKRSGSLDQKLNDDLSNNFDNSDHDKLVAKLRYLKSFHSSLSGNMNPKLEYKALESLSENKEDINESQNTGLGISSLEKNDNNLNSSFTKEDLESSQTEPVVAEPPSVTIIASDDGAKGSRVHDEATKRVSVVNMMNTLAAIDKNKEPSIPEDQEPRVNRKSVHEMMATLKSLESIPLGDHIEPSDKGNKMKDYHEKESNGLTELKATPVIKTKHPFNRLLNGSSEKRYSWFSNDETVNFNVANTSAEDISHKTNSKGQMRNYNNAGESEGADYETHGISLDDDLIDEINLLPEDFNFEEHELHDKLRGNLTEPSFFRSKSYTQKPTKFVLDNNHQSNKIETLNKTVTFYRSNTTGKIRELPSLRSRSVSRKPSTRSMNSFVSIDEEGDSEDDQKSSEMKETSPKKLGIFLDELSKSSFNLSTINETSRDANAFVDV